MLDLSDPKNPVEVGIENSFYVHDGVVKNDTLLSANINNGFLSMWDVSDKSNPLFLGSVTTPNSFTHNVWFSDDLKYAYTTDEVSGAFLTEYNIQDPSDITETDRIRTTTSKDVIPHNTHFINNFIVTSYYRDGVTIHDVSDKGNMVEVARFDTSPAFSGSGFNGCWGVYPWLPSCNIIAADIENGLYILKPAVELDVCGLLDTIEFPNSPISIYPSPFQDDIKSCWKGR
jgi:choice-of-anchor B domain-containing protein